MRTRAEKYAAARRTLRAALIVLVVGALAVAAALMPYRTLLPALPVSAREEGELRVHFLSVGQGDCTIVEFPSGAIVVVDAGDGSFANDGYVVRYVKGLAPVSVTLAITHADADHFGGAAELLRVFSVERIFLPAVGSDTGAYRRLLSAVEREGCAVDGAARYKSVLDRSGAFMVCLSPHAAGETDENASAAVFYLEYEGVRVLLSSDISAAREAALAAEYALRDDVFDNGRLTVELGGIDILKAGHHGSAGATSAPWLSLLQPKEAVISCGAGNGYGHPAGETLSRLAQAGAAIYRTDELGTIVANISDGTYTINYGERA